MAHNVFLGLGTNIGDKLKNIEVCLALINDKAGKIIEKSSVYETEPWGVENQENYYNLVIRLETHLTPSKLLSTTQAIEKEMGRVKKEKWGARIIDIDILFYDDRVIQRPGLSIPHPMLLKRNFVLEPLIEISSGFIHPMALKPLKDLRVNNVDTSWIKKLN